MRRYNISKIKTMSRRAFFHLALRLISAIPHLSLAEISFYFLFPSTSRFFICSFSFITLNFFPVPPSVFFYLNSGVHWSLPSVFNTFSFFFCDPFDFLRYVLDRLKHYTCIGLPYPFFVFAYWLCFAFKLNRALVCPSLYSFLPSRLFLVQEITCALVRPVLFFFVLYPLSKAQLCIGLSSFSRIPGKI